VNLLAVDGHGLWGGKAKPNLVAVDGHDRDADVAVDHHRFADTTGQN
jgi:hypothetical protein